MSEILQMWSDLNLNLIKISVILPSKNAEKTIERSIQSVLKQEGPWELIIEDGCSTDSTLAILSKYRNDDRIRVTSEKDQGVYFAINKGLRKCVGQLVVILNADDAFYPQAFSIIRNAYQVDTAFYYAPVEWYNPRNNMRILVNPLPLHFWLQSGLQQMPTPHVGMFIKKELIDTIGEYNTKYLLAADHDFALKIARTKAKGFMISSPVAEILAGGMSQGITAKIESKTIAIKWGKPWVNAWLDFGYQVVVAWVVSKLPVRILSLLFKKRFQILKDELK